MKLTNKHRRKRLQRKFRAARAAFNERRWREKGGANGYLGVSYGIGAMVRDSMGAWVYDENAPSRAKALRLHEAATRASPIMSRYVSRQGPEPFTLGGPKGRAC